MTTSKSDPRPAALDDAEALIRRVTEYEARTVRGPWNGRMKPNEVFVLRNDLPPEQWKVGTGIGWELARIKLTPFRRRDILDFIQNARTDLPRAIALLRVLVERVRELEAKLESYT
jgi:hypothetical protein